MFFRLFILIILLIGCKNALNQEQTSKPMSYLLAEKSCSSEELDSSDTIEKITLLHTRISKILFINNISITNNNSEDHHPLNPLILNENILERDYEILVNLIESKLDPRMVDGLLDSTSTSDKTIENISIEKRNEQLIQIGSMSRTLKDNAQVWNRYRCQIPEMNNRVKTDLRPYYQLKEKECAQGESCINPNTTLRKWRIEFNNLFDLCRLSASESKCSSEMNLKLLKNDLWSFYQFYSKRVENEKIVPRFNLDFIKKLKCEKNLDEKVIINLEVVSQSLSEDSNNRLKELIENKWNSKNTQIKVSILNDWKEGAITFELTDNNVSFVNSSNTDHIFMQNNLNITDFNLVFAHELGHSLGFPDCYLDFYDERSEEIVYFSMDKVKGTNIMCGIRSNSMAPEAYLQELVEKSCQF